jgi:Spy/CpxP family protein refolding chaperone
MNIATALKSFALTITMAALVNVAPPALAQDTFMDGFLMAQDAPAGQAGFGFGRRPCLGPHGGGGQEGQGPAGGFMAQLGLTDQQREQLKTLMQSNRQQNQGAMQALQAKRQQLKQMVVSGSGSKQQALALHQEISQQQSVLMASRISMIYDIRAILSPQQFEQFRSMMQQHRAQGGPGMGQGRPGGGFNQQGRGSFGENGFPGQRRGSFMKPADPGAQ